ncbi:MAG TPA: TolC family protein [Thermoanaerobaculia bacterium]|nr:TolC family protein [Thermoanaerobaculia bacterium]
MSRYFAAGLVSALTAFAAPAQTMVTESDFLSVLTPSHPAVAAASDELALARAALIDARAFENPSLGIAREDPSGPAGQTDLTLSWQLPDFSRGLRVEAREKEVEAAAARLSHTFLLLRLEMRELYAAWAVAAAQREWLATHMERLDELTARERLRAERGESSGLEAHRLALAANVLRARAALAAAAEREWRARARSWNPQLPADALPLLPDLPPLDAVPESHPLVVAAQADVDAALAAQRAAGRFFRSPEVMAGWQQQETAQESLAGPLWGVNWSVPLFTRNRAERAIADARLIVARARLERIRREIDARRQAAAEIYAQLASDVTVLKAAVLENEQILRGAEAAFIHGEASLTDLLETWRSATDAEMGALELREAAMAALRELERLSTPLQSIEKEIQP